MVDACSSLIDNITGGNSMNSVGDEFGSLPFEVAPGSWRRLLGYDGFFVYPDYIEFGPAKHRRKIRMSEINSVSVFKNRIEITFASSGDLRVELLYCGRSSGGLSTLINRLITEEKRRNELASTNTTGKNGTEVLHEVLEWRGRPFVAGVDWLLRVAADLNASDLHFEPLAGFSRLTLRVRNEMIDFAEIPIRSHAGLIARLKHLANCRSHITGEPQEGAFQSAQGSEVRLSVFPSVFGERCSLRFIRPIEFPDLESLNWPVSSINAWRKMLESSSGLLLINGPVGSGKTTALYASLAELSRNGKRRRVVTLEDPVEACVPGICQSSIKTSAGISLSESFKFLLRQDPDVMALGEIRDKDCLKEALQAGLSGHLVLATIHSSNNQGTIDRMKHLGIDGFSLASGLRGLLSLRLDHVPTTDSGSKVLVHSEVSGISPDLGRNDVILISESMPDIAIRNCSGENRA